MKGQAFRWSALMAIFAVLAAVSAGNERLAPVAVIPEARAVEGEPVEGDTDMRDEIDPSGRARIEMGFSPGSGIARLSDDELALDLDRMRAIGATWIRIDVPWSVIEAERGVFDWSATDRLIDAAVERDLAVVGLLAYTPAWANDDAPSDKYPPIDPADFARFAGEAAQRYRQIGVETWEVWNEPNLADFWAPSPDPDTYAELLTATSSAIRSVDPDAFVISAGLAPGVDDPSSSLSPETFLIDMFGVLPTGVIDAVGIHPYSFPADPTDRGESWNTYGRLPAMVALVKRLQAERLPLWLTEFGAPFDPDQPDRQAEIVTEGVACASRLANVGPIFVYAMRDAVEPSDEPPFGLADSDGRLRPSWTALAELMVAPETSGADCW